jgi:phosphatidate cytidylyltransferase
VEDGNPAARRRPAAPASSDGGAILADVRADGELDRRYRRVLRGAKFGRHKLAPAISPGKTWEGAVASALTAIVFGQIYLPLAIPGTSLLKAGLLALAANVAGQAGDLAESAIKRGAGVKDSGTLLPGHGGMLDRVDSTLFALPVLYALVTLLHIS